MLLVTEPVQDVLFGEVLLHELFERESLCVIDNPTALANALPILMDMIKNGWVVEVGRKEWVRYRGEELAGWFNSVIIINGTTTSVLLYRIAGLTVMLRSLLARLSVKMDK